MFKLRRSLLLFCCCSATAADSIAICLFAGSDCGRQQKIGGNPPIFRHWASVQKAGHLQAGQLDTMLPMQHGRMLHLPAHLNCHCNSNEVQVCNHTLGMVHQPAKHHYELLVPVVGGFPPPALGGKPLVFSRFLQKKGRDFDTSSCLHSGQ